MPTYPVALTITNPATGTSTTGWTNDSGALGTRSSNPVPATGFGGYFTGGTSVSTVATQVVAVPADYHADVDAGIVAADLLGLLTSFGDGDSAQLRLEALDGSSTVLGTVSSASDTSDRSWNPTRLLLSLPVGTRSLRIGLLMTRVAGTNNDGYVHRLNLWLHDERMIEAQKLAAHTPLGARETDLLVARVAAHTSLGAHETALMVTRVAAHTVAGAADYHLLVAKIAVHTVVSPLDRVFAFPQIIG